MSQAVWHSDHGAGTARCLGLDQELLRRPAHQQGVHARVYAEGVPGGGALVVAASLRATDRALSRIKFWIFLIGGVGIALAAGVAAPGRRPQRSGRSGAGPPRRRAVAADRCSFGRARVAVVSGDDELGRLATRFNEMLEALERSVGAQRRLVADASHELRTPLTAVRTNLDLLREGKLPADEAQRALDESSVELDGLTTLVADLVELARGEERKLRVEDVHLDDLVATVVERAKSRAPQMTFVTSLAPAQVSADPVLLERAISNLIDNAVKWSPAGGPVEITVRGGEVVVTDHGPGIAEEDLPASSTASTAPRPRARSPARRPRSRDRARGSDRARRHRNRRERRNRRPLPPDAARPRLTSSRPAGVPNGHGPCQSRDVARKDTPPPARTKKRRATPCLRYWFPDTKCDFACKSCRRFGQGRDPRCQIRN